MESYNCLLFYHAQFIKHFMHAFHVSVLILEVKIKKLGLLHPTLEMAEKSNLKLHKISAAALVSHSVRCNLTQFGINIMGMGRGAGGRHIIKKQRKMGPHCLETSKIAITIDLEFFIPLTTCKV